MSPPRARASTYHHHHHHYHLCRHLLVCLPLLLTPATAAAATAVPFTTCDKVLSTGGAAPSAVRMNCSTFDSHTCVVNKGNTYLLEADFIPEAAAAHVNSSVAWAYNVELPLLGQHSEACGGQQVSCPLLPGTPAAFTYPLYISPIWMRRHHPLVWRLKDEDTGHVILCFKVDIKIP